MRTPRARYTRTLGAAAVALGVAVGLGGCGAGQIAQTAVQVTATGGAEGQVGSMLVRDAAFTYDRPVPGGAVYEPGEDAPLQLTIVNHGAEADRLVAVSSPIASSARIVGDARVPGGQTLTAGYDEPVAAITVPPAGAVAIVLVDIASPVRAGINYPVVFTFERAGDLHLNLPVEYPEDVLPPRARDAQPDRIGTLETGPEIPTVPR